MIIYIKTSFGLCIGLKVNGWHTIENLKDKLEQVEGTPTSKQRLSIDGKRIVNEGTLTYHNVQNESILFLYYDIPWYYQQKKYILNKFRIYNIEN
jgi:hypothetical protein